MTPIITLLNNERDAEGFTPYVATFTINTLGEAAEFYCGIADGWGALSPTLKSIAFANQLATAPCPSPAPSLETPCLSPAQTGQLSTLPCQMY
jgi:hypothetical protein